MFDLIFDGKDFSYFHNRETGQYILSSKKYKIRITISGEEAELFKNHIELINNNPNEAINNRIERTIGIHLYFCIYAALDNNFISE